jgi:hypothetical protein
MPDRLRFADSRTTTDFMTFAGRARTLLETGVRVKAEAGLATLTVAPLAPRGLFDHTPTVLVMRIARVDPELVCDIVVDAQDLRVSEDDASSVILPETGLAPSWAGISPPRTGWHEDGAIGASVLAARAQWGIASVAENLPKDAGEDAVRATRAATWGVPDAELDDLPLGVAFAAFVMGLIAGDESVVVRRAGPWSRLTLNRGHVIVRGPARSGLGDVRVVGGP